MFIALGITRSVAVIVTTYYEFNKKASAKLYAKMVVCVNRRVK